MSAAQLIEALSADDATSRLKAALAAGTNPETELVDTLIARCGIEPDFYVRDMLTWALTRFPSELTVPRLLSELDSETTQARSQALHTLSKIKDPATWPAITPSLLRDKNDEAAQSAWRAAVILVPDTERPGLAEELAAQFGRGNREVQLSLSRALVSLGEPAIASLLKQAQASDDPTIQAHAIATEKLLLDPDAEFQLGIDQVKRMLAPGQETHDENNND